jgi:nucleotide-binding universal stress UspA family protein
MKKILVPTDLSHTAELGLKLAVEIAKRSGASISLVNFTRHPFGSTFSATGEVDLRADEEEDRTTLEYLKRLKGKLEELALKYTATGISMEVAVVDNEFAEGIDEYLKAESIDLVVMGTSGEENVSESFTGNHTVQTIRVSTCPVLSVRDGFDINDFNTIVVGVHVISDNKVALGLNVIRDLATAFNSTVHLVHIREDETDTNIILDQYFTQMAQIAGLQNAVVRILDADDKAEALGAYASEVGAGLIAIIKNRKEGIFRLFSNRLLSNRMVKEEGRPVITVNLQNVNDR